MRHYLKALVFIFLSWPCYAQPKGICELATDLKSRGLDPKWAAVAIAETGWSFDKGVARHNNLFAMRRPRVRMTTCIGETPGGYAIYSTWQDAVKDLSYWAGVSPQGEEEDFISYLRRRKWNTQVMSYHEALMDILRTIAEEECIRPE